ncbi:hypothetical protein [Velocimicrobium porci]|uniref:DUF1795 domain-containing protein n=1 Tax=Velocimicrobium porci TaxID=2606634 RepID=A0A6L5Y279_9FIRM|nr:hypothetical protein [Velocimicrobium porci]MSS65034.1 hypothetical protein [Velocimicrobium porci]
MKKYGDEDFIFLISEQEQEIEEEKTQVNNIYEDSVLIQGETYEISEIMIIEDGFTMRIPKAFVKMPKEIARIKYPSSQRPDIIWSNEETTVNIAFTYKEELLEDEETKELRDAMKGILLKVNPSIREVKCNCLTVEQKTIASLEFVSSALDEEIYNLMFFFSLKGRLLMGTFNCVYSEKENWLDIFWQMMKSIHF